MLCDLSRLTRTLHALQHDEYVDQAYLHTFVNEGEKYVDQGLIAQGSRSAGDAEVGLVPMQGVQEGAEFGAPERAVWFHDSTHVGEMAGVDYIVEEEVVAEEEEGKWGGGGVLIEEASDDGAHAMLMEVEEEATQEKGEREEIETVLSVSDIGDVVDDVDFSVLLHAEDGTYEVSEKSAEEIHLNEQETGVAETGDTEEGLEDTEVVEGALDSNEGSVGLEENGVEDEEGEEEDVLGEEWRLEQFEGSMLEGVASTSVVDTGAEEVMEEQLDMSVHEGDSACVEEKEEKEEEGVVEENTEEDELEVHDEEDADEVGERGAGGVNVEEAETGVEEEAETGVEETGAVEKQETEDGMDDSGVVQEVWEGDESSRLPSRSLSPNDIPAVHASSIAELEEEDDMEVKAEEDNICDEEDNMRQEQHKADGGPISDMIPPVYASSNADGTHDTCDKSSIADDMCDTFDSHEKSDEPQYAADGVELDQEEVDVDTEEKGDILGDEEDTVQEEQHITDIVSMEESSHISALREGAEALDMAFEQSSVQEAEGAEDLTKHVASDVDAYVDGVHEAMVPVHFELPTAHDAVQVSIIGSWDQWQEPVKLSSSRQTAGFAADVLVPLGMHTFQFIVDGKRITSDEWDVETDLHGNLHNVVVVRAASGVPSDDSVGEDSDVGMRWRGFAQRYAACSEHFEKEDAEMLERNQGVGKGYRTDASHEAEEELRVGGTITQGDNDAVSRCEEQEALQNEDDTFNGSVEASVYRDVSSAQNERDSVPVQFDEPIVPGTSSQNSAS